MDSGCSLRRSLKRADLRGRATGLRPAEAAGRTVLTNQSKLAISPQPSGRACDEQREIAALRQGAAAGCRSLRDRTFQHTPHFAAAGCRRCATEPFGTRHTPFCNCGLPVLTDRNNTADVEAAASPRE